MKKKIYLKYLFNDNGPEAHLNPEVINGVLRESLEYGKDPDAEYIPLNPKTKKRNKMESKKSTVNP
jgi:hypothetical protein